VFNNPSRVVRESASYLHYKELSRKHGTGIVCVSDDGSLKGLDAPHRKVMTFMQGYASEMDNANRTRVFREKKAERFRRGQLAAGRLPLGYRYDKQARQVEVNEEQAAAVRTIFDLYVKQDLSIARVALRLKDVGIPPPSKLRGFNYKRRVDDAWDFDVIRNILEERLRSCTDAAPNP
jgi:site-specific DNA recombinase